MMMALLQAAAPVDSYQWLASLGVGGVLAGVVLVQSRADRKASEERLAEFAKNFMTIVQDNTKAMQSVVDAVQHMKR